MSSNRIKKVINLINNPKIRFGYFSRIGLNRLLSDQRHIEKEYFLNFHKKLNLDHPKTFNEKIQWLKLYDRNPQYTIMVDKYLAKKYVANIIGQQYIIPTIGIYEKYDDIDLDSLPNQFVMKCTHDSGGIVICKDKSFFNNKIAKRKINSFLKRKYYYIHREWPYKNIKPQIIVEKYMKNGKDDELIDYKIMCFGGKAKMIFTCTERYSEGLKVTFFDLNWKKLPFERHYPSSAKKIPKPKNLKKMIELSEIIAKDIPFVRVDWYEINEKPYFGECTFYPGSGLEEFTPEIWDYKLGELIKLNNTAE